MFKKLLLIFGLSISWASQAEILLYEGTLNLVWANAEDGGFIITFKSPSPISACPNHRAYFRSETFTNGSEILRNSLSIALSAFHTDSTVGIFLDTSNCNATGIYIKK